MEDANKNDIEVLNFIDTGKNYGGNVGLLSGFGMSYEVKDNGEEIYKTRLYTEKGYGSSANEKTLQAFAAGNLKELESLRDVNLDRYKPKPSKEPEDLEPSNNFLVNVFRAAKNYSGAERTSNTIHISGHPRDVLEHMKVNDTSNSLFDTRLADVEAMVSKFEEEVVGLRTNAFARIEANNMEEAVVSSTAIDNAKGPDVVNIGPSM